MKSLDIALIVVVGVLAVVGFIWYTGPECGNGVLEGRLPDPRFEECDDGNLDNDDGCSSACLVEFPYKIYIAHYMGNIDGGFADEWFFFYDQLLEFWETEGIKVGATVYPASIDDTPEFAPYIARLYESPNVELVQKAFTGLGAETKMDSMTHEQVREIIENGREAYVTNIAEAAGIPEEEIAYPLAYNQPQGRFTADMRDVLEEMNFTIFFEMYMNEDIGPVKSSPNVDVLQYGVGFTKAGVAGKQSEFFQPGEFLLNVRRFSREDLNMLYINQSRLVPVWVHHMDFERQDKPNAVDREKWAIYTYVMKRIREEPNLIMVSPQEIWELRHP